MFQITYDKGRTGSSRVTIWALGKFKGSLWSSLMRIRENNIRVCSVPSILPEIRNINGLRDSKTLVSETTSLEAQKS